MRTLEPPVIKTLLQISAILVIVPNICLATSTPVIGGAKRTLKPPFRGGAVVHLWSR